MPDEIRVSLLAGGLGFEPRLTESESPVLPLNYPPPGTACTSSFATDATLSATDLGHLAPHSKPHLEWRTRHSRRAAARHTERDGCDGHERAGGDGQDHCARRL